MKSLLFHKGRGITCFILALVMALILPVQAFAYHGVARTEVNDIDGTYFYATIEDMDSEWTSTNDTRFILHTTWILNNDDTWIENGFVDGAMQEPDGDIVYHNGYYTASGVFSTGDYEEYIITGPSTGINTSHSFHIQRDGTSTWGVYVDFTLRRSYSWETSADRIDVGLETNTTVSSSDEWNERNFQYYENGSWYDWDDGSIIPPDHSSIDISWDDEPTSIFTSKD